MQEVQDPLLVPSQPVLYCPVGQLGQAWVPQVSEVPPLPTKYVPDGLVEHDTQEPLLEPVHLLRNCPMGHEGHASEAQLLVL